MSASQSLTVHDGECHFLDADVSSLLNKIANVTSSDAHFKSLQIDDPDLSFTEKRVIATGILKQSPSRFLARFGKFIDSDEDLAYFDECFRNVSLLNDDESYTMEFYLKEIRERIIGQKQPRQGLRQDYNGHRNRNVQVKNRRYEALQRLINTGEYFSNIEMRRRNPLMFEQLVGQHMSQSEKEDMEKTDKADLRLTTILMEHIDRDREENLRKRQLAIDEMEEEESSDEDVPIEDEGNSKTPEASSGRSVSHISDREKQMLREEFLSSMYRSFLDGGDADFNYSSVDLNTDYDSVEAKQQDAEDDYFDAEDPITIAVPEASPAPEEPSDYNAPITNFV